ncbi:MAG: hypothetical protein MZV70_48820 [Desulfobacterales bacterium]|nr:hypothetical protein [Desulfobacterales bacterium]
MRLLRARTGNGKRERSWGTTEVISINCWIVVSFASPNFDLPDIDNEPVIMVNVPEIVEQETCLFHRSVVEGADYLELLHKFVERGYDGAQTGFGRPFRGWRICFLQIHTGVQQSLPAGRIGGGHPKGDAPAYKRVQEAGGNGKMAPLIFPEISAADGSEHSSHSFGMTKRLPPFPFWIFFRSKACMGG